MSGSNARWYQEAVIYELHVRSFQDSDGDGIGDFAGLTSRLDYLADLGVTALWVLPFYPSPLRDDGYDIADYTGVNPSYGRLADLKRFLKAAKERNLRVITELVMNHTSDQHEWFQKSRRAAPESPWRDFYVWSDDPERYSEARIIFGDFEASNWTWDDVAGAYYWHRFYSHQPDLNFENPAVREAMFDVIDRWMEMGVDGVRLDAVPYLFEEEGTNCENLPATHEFLKQLRAHVDEKFDDRMLLAEANQWPEDAAAYFGDGDECHMNFHFPVMPRLFMGLRMEDRTPIVDILEQTPDIPEGTQWATFLRNHDELTLEMVTDEERDYMYRAYAYDDQMRVNLGIRRRLAPLLGNDRRKIELLNGLLFSLPGTPVVYYGDEIGMGDNVYLGDRDAVRTPMQWSPDRNGGFSRANPHSLFLPPITDPAYHFETTNVEAQSAEPNSLLRWMRQLIALRRRHPSLGRGDVDFLEPENPHVLAFLRSDPDGGDPVLVVANLSRHAQAVELDLREHLGATPVEVFGSVPFAPIGELPYYLTLAPYGFFWFTLEPRASSAVDGGGARRTIPVIDASWPKDVSNGKVPAALQHALADFVVSRRWFGGKDRTRAATKLRSAIPVPDGSRRKTPLQLCLVEVSYTDGDPETYVVPLTLVQGHRAHEMALFRPEAVVARLGGDEDSPAIVDAMAEESAVLALAKLLTRRTNPPAGDWTLISEASGALRAVMGGDPEVRLLGVEQSNTSVIIDNEVVLKLVRRLEAGINPDLELGRHLSAVGFAHTPAIVGSLELERRNDPPSTVLVASEYVPSEGDAWTVTVDAVGRFFEDTVGSPEAGSPPKASDREAGDRLIGASLEMARLLGQRTAELHGALAVADDDMLAPEAFTKLFQRSLYQSFRNQIRATTALLTRRRKHLPAEIVEAVRDPKQLDAALLERLAILRDQRLTASRIRVHGDFHLGQVLWTGRDVVIIDFEGEPARPIGERRIKRSPLADVAGMLRSFQYAAHVGLRNQVERGILAESHLDEVTPWAEWWRKEMSDAFLSAYRHGIGEGDTVLVPPTDEEFRILLDAYLIEKACYEVRYELANRPGWAGIPVAALLEHLGR